MIDDKLMMIGDGHSRCTLGQYYRVRAETYRNSSLFTIHSSQRCHPEWSAALVPRGIEGS